MSTLTENVVLSRTRSQDLRSVKKLNCWGSELRDVSIVQRLPNVEVLSLSINHIRTLADFSSCRALQELYLRQNKISDINELLYLTELPELRKLWLAENPCSDFENYRMTVLKALPNLEFLDNIRVTPEEVMRAERDGYDLQWPGSDAEDNDEINQQILPQESQIAPTHTQTSTPQVYQPSPQPQPQPPPAVQQTVAQPQPPLQALPQQTSVETMVITGANPNQNCYQSPMSNSNANNTYQTSNSSANSSPRETTPQLEKRSQTMIKSNSLSDYNLYNVEIEGKNHCKLCNCPLSKNITRSKKHFLDKCKGLPSDPDEAVAIKADSDDSYDSNDGNAMVGVSPHSGAAYDQAFQYEANASNYSGSSGYANTPAVSSARISSAPNGSSQRLLPKGGKHRNANILSAVLCLIKELDYASLEVVDTTIHCRMEEMED